MLCCQFIFQPGEYDAEFHALDTAIAEYAESMTGYIGSESWVSPDGTRRNAIYYFADASSLQEFSRVGEHLEAKQKYHNWYDGYLIIVSEVKGTYGDGRLPHLLGKGGPAEYVSDVVGKRRWKDEADQST